MHIYIPRHLIEFSSSSAHFQFLSRCCCDIRLNALIHGEKPHVTVDGVIWHLVKIFGSPCEYSLIRKCEKLVMLIGSYSNQIKVELREKGTLMESAIQGEASFDDKFSLPKP